jgi:hypothetical protein
MRQRIVWMLTGALLLLAVGARGEQPVLLPVAEDLPESAVVADGWLPDDPDTLLSNTWFDAAEPTPDAVLSRAVVVLPEHRFPVQPPVRGPPIEAPA